MILFIYLRISQRSIHTPVVYTIAFTLFIQILIMISAKLNYILYQVSCYLSHSIKEVVLIVVLWNPKCNILLTYWILRVWFEWLYLTFLELFQKSFIFRPEQSNIRNFKELHSPSFETQAKCPSYLLIRVSSSISKNFIVDHTRS